MSVLGSAFFTATERIRSAELAAKVLESSAVVLERQLRAREQELTGAREEAQALRGQIAAAPSAAGLRAGARRFAQMLRSRFAKHGT